MVWESILGVGQNESGLVEMVLRTPLRTTGNASQTGWQSAPRTTPTSRGNIVKQPTLKVTDKFMLLFKQKERMLLNFCCRTGIQHFDWVNWVRKTPTVNFSGAEHYESHYGLLNFFRVNQNQMFSLCRFYSHFHKFVTKIAPLILCSMWRFQIEYSERTFTYSWDQVHLNACIWIPGSKSTYLSKS